MFPTINYPPQHENQTGFSEPEPDRSEGHESTLGVSVCYKQREDDEERPLSKRISSDSDIYSRNHDLCKEEEENPFDQSSMKVEERSEFESGLK